MNKKMKLLIFNIIKITLFGVLFSTLLCSQEEKIESPAQSPTIDFTQPEKAYLKTKKSIRMCIDPSWMPFEAFDKKYNHIGMSMDFFKIFQKKLGIEIKAVRTKDWKESLQFAKDRKCDILSLAMPTPQRRKYMNFTAPYIDTPLVIATKPNVTYVDDIKQLKDHKIGIIKGYAVNEIIRNEYPTLDVVDVENIEEGLQKVIDGEIFGFIGSLVSIGYQFQTNFTGEVKISGKFDQKWELGIGVRNDDDILLGIFEKAINNLTFEQKQKIMNKWVYASVKKVVNYEHIVKIIIVFMVFVLLSLYWMIRLFKANKIIKESSDTFEYLFNNTIEGIVLIQDNIIVDVNESGLKLFGVEDKRYLVGKSPFYILATDSIEIAKQKIMLQDLSPYEVNGKRDDGSIYPALIRASGAVINGKESRIIGVIDLSELKEKERALELAKEKAEESTKTKSEFLANMSHEIRTPMHGIIGMTHLALETSLDAKQQKFLNTIQGSANSLLKIINDILDFSKIEAEKMEINKIDFNLEHLLDSVFSIVKFKAEEKGLDFVVKYERGLNMNLFGDSLRISQILINLLNNAIKFTENGHVHIHISSKNNLYTFTVEDSGIGMDDMQQSKLFRAFSQADGSTTRKYGGTGLGLSISKQLVELMHGKLWVESQLTKGSFFIFELELEEAKNEIVVCEKKKIGTKDIQVLIGSNILLVEDNITNQEIVVGLLEKSGINIDIANNGAEALDMYHSNPDKYELILMDLQMPILNGFEASKLIRATNKDIPIIALTANAMKEDIEKTKSVGMNEHLNKPIDVEKLYATLFQYISKKVASVELQAEETSGDVTIPIFINIETKVGLSHMAGNKKLYMKVLDDFYTSYKDLKLDDLNEEEFARTIHTLKGLSANIGAGSLNASINELERTEDKTLLGVLRIELDKVINELETMEKEESTIAELTLSDSKRDELFAKLKDAVQSKRAKKCKLVVQELQPYKLSPHDSELFNKVKLFLEKYDFKNASKILEELE